MILDLDETLIHASTITNKNGNKHDFMFERYYVYKRPFLKQFLEYCLVNFQVAVWSSASEEYVEHIVREIFPNPGELIFIWGRNKCTNRISEKDRYSSYFSGPIQLKNLRKVKRKGYDLRKVIVIDNTLICHQKNYGNLIHVEDYEANPDDKELIYLMKYLELIKDEPNIRAIEKRGWRSQV
ncbi:MAG: HAD family hydrolase [bacterium]